MKNDFLYSRRGFVGTSLAFVLGGCLPAALADVELLSVISGRAAQLSEVFNLRLLQVPRDLIVGLLANEIFERLKPLWHESSDDLHRLVTAALNANADVRLAVEAAKIVGADTLINCFDEKTNLWYQFNHNEAPVNAFAYTVTTAGNPVQGDLQFQIVDSRTGREEMPPFRTDGFSMAGNSRFSDALPVKMKFLPNSGEKRVNIVGYPAGVDVTVSKLMVLPMSP